MEIGSILSGAGAALSGIGAIGGLFGSKGPKAADLMDMQRQNQLDLWRAQLPAGIVTGKRSK